LTQFGSSLACLSTSQFQNSRFEQPPNAIPVDWEHIESCSNVGSFAFSISTDYSIFKVRTCALRTE